MYVASTKSDCVISWKAGQSSGKGILVASGVFAFVRTLTWVWPPRFWRCRRISSPNPQRPHMTGIPQAQTLHHMLFERTSQPDTHHRPGRRRFCRRAYAPNRTSLRLLILDHRTDILKCCWSQLVWALNEKKFARKRLALLIRGADSSWCWCSKRRTNLRRALCSLEKLTPAAERWLWLGDLKGQSIRFTSITESRTWEPGKTVLLLRHRTRKEQRERQRE